MNNVEKITNDYLNFSGVRSADEIKKLLNRANETNARPGSPEYFKLAHIRQQLTKAYFAAQSQQSKLLSLEISSASLFKFDDHGLGKFKDTGDIPSGGRQDEYWTHDSHKPKVQFSPRNTNVRRGPELPQSFNIENEPFLLKHFYLRGVEYGQWLTQQDRVNYLAGCALAMYDLHKILGLSHEQIGMFGLITVAFGARGRGTALAHFEPSTFAINLTRFTRPKNGTYLQHGYDRTKLMFYSGGVGSFCHEYGHALDYFCGTFIEPAPHQVKGREATYWRALSFGRQTRTAPDRELMKKNSLRGIMERLLYRIIWKKDGTDKSTYYKRVKKAAEEFKGSDYYIRRNELFARCFESYVFFKLKRKGWFNLFLNEPKYEGAFYPTESELREFEKTFDELIHKMQSAIKPIKRGK